MAKNNLIILHFLIKETQTNNSKSTKFGGYTRICLRAAQGQREVS